MAFFGKSDALAEGLGRLEAGGPFAAGELDRILGGVLAHPDFRVERTLWMLRSPSRKVRDFVAQQLSQLPDPGALAPAFVRELVAAPPALRPEVARVVDRLAGERAVGLLVPLLHAAAPEKRDAALELVGAREDGQTALALLRDALHDPEPELRHKAVRILARWPDNPSIFVLLRDLINDEDVGVRRIIIEAFARRPVPEIVEPFFKRLVIEGEREREAIIGALSALARTAQAEVEERVLPMLSDESAAVRETAVRLLSEMPDRTRLLRTFLLHCRGQAFWLRDRSLASIRSMSGNLVEPLLELMRAGEPEDVRVGALLLAGGARDERILPLAVEMFSGELSWWVRSTAAEVLNSHPGEEISALLASGLDDPNLRYGIISLLASREGKAAAAALRRRLGHPEGVVRRAVLVALARRGGEEALELISKAAAEDDDPSVREKATELLAGAGRKGVKPAVRRLVEGAGASPGEELCMENEGLNSRRRPGAEPR